MYCCADKRCAAAFSPVARLVSSSQSCDELYGLLVRMSFQDDSLPSLASRYAISALSYQHLAMDKTAVMHQTRAIRALQSAIETAVPSECMQLMAASMLLNIYEVCNGYITSFFPLNLRLQAELLTGNRRSTLTLRISAGPSSSVGQNALPTMSQKQTTRTLGTRHSSLTGSFTTTSCISLVFGIGLKRTRIRSCWRRREKFFPRPCFRQRDRR